MRRLAPTFELLFHFNRMGKKPHKTSEAAGSIRYYTGKGILRTPDGDGMQFATEPFL